MRRCRDLSEILKAQYLQRKKNNSSHKDIAMAYSVTSSFMKKRIGAKNSSQRLNKKVDLVLTDAENTKFLILRSIKSISYADALCFSIRGLFSR